MNQTYDPSDLFWGYYEKVKQERGGIVNASIAEMAKLAKFFKVMQYFEKIKSDIDAMEFNIFFKEYQKNKLKKYPLTNV